MKNNKSKDIVIMTIFASLYTAIVGVFVFMSFNPFQARLADALLPLSIIFGIPSILGFGLGAFISNFIFGGLGPLDIFGGAAANIIACTIAYYFARRKGILYRFFGVLIEALLISFIVGGYLSILFFESPLISILGVLIGSLISIVLIGFPIEEIIINSSIYKFIQEN